MNYKNPFAIRASERIETDERFLELFSVEPLSYLEDNHANDSLWGTLTYILSSPGAGKTTLLRLFSPSVLQRVTAKSTNLIFRKLMKIGVKDNYEQIQKCGVYLQMGRDYEFLEDDDLFGQREQRRIFLALLNARIVLATLKTCMTLAGIKYTSLQDITYTPEEPVNQFGELKEIYTGKDLLDWATKQERKVCEFLDCFVVPADGIDGNDELFALNAMKAEWFQYDGKPLCHEFIFQIDDGHKLTERQKRIIRSEVAERRIHATLWIAERLETLSTEDILSDNNIQGRDYQVIKLEMLSQSLFKKMAKGVASMRSKVSYDGIDLFTYLSEITTENYNAAYNDACRKYFTQMETLASYPNYLSCIKAIGQEDPYDRAKHSRAMLIYASREDSAPRLFEYDYLEMMGILSKDYNDYAEELLPGEISKIPQYYGQQTLIDLASGNIEQFLSMASKMYELLLSKKIMDTARYDLTPEDQDKIVSDYCKSHLEDVKQLQRGNKIYAFLMHLIDFCREQTFSPTYSYRTVSGFAVKEENTGQYGLDGFWFQDPANEELAILLKDCLANNLLYKVPRTQGKKDQNWAVFYLNEWLCAYAHLPLRRGGWRKLSLYRLNQWAHSVK